MSPRFVAPFIAVAASGLLMLMLGNEPGAPPPPVERVLGIWADRADADPTHALHLWQVSRSFEGGGMWVRGASALEGHFEATGLMGAEPVVGTWNYGSWDPLVLNLVWPDASGRNQVAFLALELSDDRSVRARVTPDAEQAVRSGFLEGAEVRTLQRVAPAEAPRPGEPIRVPE